MISKNNERRKAIKLNNEGISMLEFVVVIAIMAVVVGIATFSFSIVTNTRMKEAATNLYDSLEMLKQRATTISADEWNITIEKTDEDTYVYQINKVIITTDEDTGKEKVETSAVETKQMSGNYEIVFKDTSTNKEYKFEEGKQMKIIFSKNQGEITKITMGDEEVGKDGFGNMGDMGEFIVSNSIGSRRVELYYVTGNAELIVD